MWCGAACSIAVVSNAGTAGMGVVSSLVMLACWRLLSIQHSQSFTGVKLFTDGGHVHSLASYKQYSAPDTW